MGIQLNIFVILITLFINSVNIFFGNYFQKYFQKKQYYFYTSLVFLVDCFAALIVTLWSMMAIAFVQQILAVNNIAINNIIQLLLGNILSIISFRIGIKFIKLLINPKGNLFKNYKDPEYGEWFVMQWFGLIFSAIINCTLLVVSIPLLIIIKIFIQ